MKTQFGSVSILGQDNNELKEYGVRISDDGKQIRCSILATTAQTLKYFKASIHVFIDGLWQEGRILTGGLEGTILGRTVGQNMYQPFIFTEASLSDLADDDTRAGAITIELWHVEIVSQTNPTAWNSLGQQAHAPSPNISHTTSFGPATEDERIGTNVMITKPLFSEPFLVVTFDYMSRDFLEQLGLIGLSYVEGAISYVAPTPSLTPDIDLTATDISKPTRKKNPKKKKQELVIPEITFEDSYAPAAL